MKILKKIAEVLIVLLMMIGMIMFFGWVWLTDPAYGMDKVTINEYSEVLENATDEDFRAFEQVILNESVNAFGYEEQGMWECSVATAECVLNRVLSDKFPNTIHEVVYQRGQFCTINQKGTEIQREIVCDVIDHIWHEGRTMLPETDYLFFATNTGCQKRYAKDFVFYGKWKNLKPSKGHYIGRAR